MTNEKRNFYFKILPPGKRPQYGLVTLSQLVFLLFRGHVFIGVTMEGYFKLHRKILESQVFTHQTALKIWLWCLAKATFKERFVPLKVGRGETIVKLLPGQFLFGRFKAEEELGIDGSTVYKWIQKFASSEFEMISIDSNNQYSVITICNWEEYQIKEDEKEQPSNNQVTTEEHLCNTNKKDKKEEESINPIGENSIFLDKIIQVYAEEHGDYKILNLKKEREYAEMILKEYKSTRPNTDEQKVLDDLRIVFNGCINIDDKWKRENMCIRYIANNYNVLKQYFKNGNSTGKQQGATTAGIARAIAKNFASDYRVPEEKH